MTAAIRPRPTPVVSEISVQASSTVSNHGGSKPRKEPDARKDPNRGQANALTLRRVVLDDPDMDGFVGWNELTLAPVLLKPIPDPDAFGAERFQSRPWEDGDATRLAIYFQDKGYAKATNSLAQDVMSLVADTNRYHPVRQYLDGLVHDGVPRLSGWLMRYAGTPSDGARQRSYVAAVSRAVLIGAVARVYQPGCKLDTMMILEGPQGALKSSLIRALCHDPAWFSDTMPADLDTKDARQHLRGNWILELSEIAALRKSEVESLKAFLSAQTDKYRPTFGRNEVTRERQSIFIGSTNETAYLVDITGNRRFWPVRVGEVDLGGIVGARDQLWAEAVAAYKAGEPWWLTGDVAAHAAAEQDDRVLDDEWRGPVCEYLKEHTSAVLVRDILHQKFGLDDAKQGKPEQMRVAAVLSRLGYRKTTQRMGGYVVKAWLPPSKEGNGHV